MIFFYLSTHKRYLRYQAFGGDLLSLSVIPACMCHLGGFPIVYKMGVHL